MATDAEEFFRKRRETAMVKHDIIAGYLAPYVSKVGFRSLDHRVSYIDGYAGPGSYDTEEPGSPEVAMAVAESLSGQRDLQGHFIEEKKSFAERLRVRLDDAGYDRWEVHHGDVKKQLPAVLAKVDEDPLLVFLDPYGLAVPFRQLMDLLLRRQAITEVVLNF